MSQRTEQAKHAVKAPAKNTGKIVETLIATLAIRLVIAAVIFAVTLIVDMPGIVRGILLILSAVVSGYDVFLEAINAVEEGNYFATPLIVVFVAAIGFVVGYGAESVALIILYQIGLLAVAYAAKRTRASAIDLVRDQDEEVKARMRDVVQDKSAGKMAISSAMGDSAAFILRFAIIFAVIYAIVVPLFTAFPFRVSIHRALMIILVSTPGSVVAAMPLTGIMGLCMSARKGILFHNAAGLEKAAGVDTVVFDKSGIFSDDEPEILSVDSGMLDEDTFMNFAAHAVYYSDQPFAKAISAIYDQAYKLELISEFRDLPGVGVMLKIGGNPVLLATREYLNARGVQLPDGAREEGQAYHLIVAGRYIGKLVLSPSVNERTGTLVEDMQALGLDNLVLLAEDAPEKIQHLAEDLGFTEGRSVDDAADKMGVVSDLSSGRGRVMFVYASGIEAHSAAAVDVRVSKRAKYADAVVIPDQVANLPAGIAIGRRTVQIAKMNALFAFGIKTLLIFLSILGYCTLWFAIFLDMAASIATILNTIRVTIPPRAPVDDEEDEE